MHRFLRNNGLVIALSVLTIGVALLPEIAHAANVAIIDEGVEKARSVYDGLRKGLYVVFGFAVLVLAGLAMFTRFKWSTFLYACLGMLLVVGTDQIVSLLTDGRL